MASSETWLNPELFRRLQECKNEADFGTLAHLLRHTNEDMSIKLLPLAGEDGFYNHRNNTFQFDGKPYSYNLIYMIGDVVRYADELARYRIDTSDAASLHRLRVVAEKARLCCDYAEMWMANAESLDIAFHVAARNLSRPLTAAERRYFARSSLPAGFDLGRLEPWSGRDRPFLQAQCNGAPSAAGVASERVRGRPSPSSQQAAAPLPSAAPEHPEAHVSVEGNDRLRAIMGVLRSVFTPDDVDRVLADFSVDYVRPMGSDARLLDEIAMPRNSSEVRSLFFAGTLTSANSQDFPGYRQTPLKPPVSRLAVDVNGTISRVACCVDDKTSLGQSSIGVVISRPR